MSGLSPGASASGLFFEVFLMGTLVCGYGLVAPAQIKQFAQAVCNVLGSGEGNAAVYLRCETAAAEMHYVTYMSSIKTMLLASEVEVSQFVESVNKSVSLFDEAVARINYMVNGINKPNVSLSDRGH